MESINKKITFNMLYQIAGKIFSTILGLIVIGMMTRYLGKKGFGQYTTIMAFLQFFGILVDFGLTLTTTQMISEPDADTDKIMSNIFSLRLISAVLFLGIAPLVVLFFPYPQIVKVGIAISTLSFFFIALYQIFVGVFQKNLVTQKIAIAESINRVGLLIMVFGAIYYDKGLLGIMVAIVLSNFFHFIMHYLFALKYVKIRWEIDLALWKKILSRTWPIAITIIFNLIYFKADTLILSIFKSEEEVGIYGAPYKMLEVLTTFPYLFSGLMLPFLTKYWAENEYFKFKKMFQKGFDTLSIIAIPMMFGTFILAKPMMIFVAGQDFEKSGVILQILIIATAIIYFGNIFSHSIVAINQQKKVIPYYIVTAIISLICYLIFIPKYSIYGAASITVFSELLIAISIYYLVYKTTRFIPNFKVWPAAILSSLAMAQLLYLWTYFISDKINILNMFSQVMLGIFVYFYLMIYLGGLDTKVIKEIIQLK